jgi:23S rRNA (uracil1939-C5)-methyltransferase
LEHLTSIHFHHLSAEEYVRLNAITGTLILDPPRCGAKDVMKFLSAAKLSRIIYVSCNLSTLARDLKMLCAQGFSLKQLFVIDMFPQTHHIELVALL